MAQAAIYVENLSEVRAALKRIAPDLAPILTTNMKQAADTTVRWSVVGKMPQRSGDAAASVKATGSRSGTVYMQGGGAGAPYFGWLDFGGVLKPTGNRYNTISRPKIRSGRYLYPGVYAAQPQLLKAINDALRDVTNRFNAR